MTNSQDQGFLEQLQDHLIIAGLPSSNFDLQLVTVDGHSRIQLTGHFRTVEGQEFAFARWVWIVITDARFDQNADDPYKHLIRPDSVPTFCKYTGPIENLPTATVESYFVDHNINQLNLTVTLEDDHITQSEDETEILIDYRPEDSNTEEERELGEEGWEKALTPVFDQTDPYSATITVSNARTLVADYFDKYVEAIPPLDE